MPEFSAISHVSFSVRDADKTAQWWRDVFGLDDATAIEHETWRAILLFLTPQIAIEFQEHRANKGVKVDSLAELEAWQTHFEEKGVEHTPIVEKDYGDGPTYVLTFKDPDRIQFEMFHWEHHP
jgi:glyoxylase I family protein